MGARTMISARVSRSFIFTSCFLFSACRGPSPIVKDVTFAVQDREHSIYGMSIKIQNNGGGEGEIKVKGTLVERRTGLTYKEDKTVELDPHEITTVHLWIAAPVGEYDSKAEVEYPPK